MPIKKAFSHHAMSRCLESWFRYNGDSLIIDLFGYYRDIKESSTVPMLTHSGLGANFSGDAMKIPVKPDIV
jgi:hypothetical protein